MSFKRFLNSHFVFGNKNHISFFQGSSFRFAVIIFIIIVFAANLRFNCETTKVFTAFLFK